MGVFKIRFGEVVKSRIFRSCKSNLWEGDKKWMKLDEQVTFVVNFPPFSPPPPLFSRWANLPFTQLNTPLDWQIINRPIAKDDTVTVIRLNIRLKIAITF